jgi:hypothetical protein
MADAQESPMRKEILIFIFSLGFLFFTWPVLSIFRDVMAVYLYAAWLAFILALFLIAKFSKSDDGGA